MNHFVPPAGLPAIQFTDLEKRFAPRGKSATVRARRRLLHDLPSARRAVAGGLT